MGSSRRPWRREQTHLQTFSAPVLRTHLLRDVICNIMAWWYINALADMFCRLMINQVVVSMEYCRY